MGHPTTEVPPEKLMVARLQLLQGETKPTQIASHCSILWSSAFASQRTEVQRTEVQTACMRQEAQATDLAGPDQQVLGHLPEDIHVHDAAAAMPAEG